MVNPWKFLLVVYEKVEIFNKYWIGEFQICLNNLYSQILRYSPLYNIKHFVLRILPIYMIMQLFTLCATTISNFCYGVFLEIFSVFEILIPEIVNVSIEIKLIFYSVVVEKLLMKLTLHLKNY